MPWTCCILRFWKGCFIFYHHPDDSNAVPPSLSLLRSLPPTFISPSSFSLSPSRLPPLSPRSLPLPSCLRLRWHLVVQPSSSSSSSSPTLEQGQVRTSVSTSSDLFSLPSQRPIFCVINSAGIAKTHHVGAHRWNLETVMDKHNNWNKN